MNSLYSYVIVFLLGLACAWPLSTFRVNMVQLRDMKQIIELQKTQMQQNKAIEDEWQKQMQKNIEIANQLLAEQKSLMARFDQQENKLHQSFNEVKDAAKKVALTNYRIDAEHQRLLKAISEAANQYVASP